MIARQNPALTNYLRELQVGIEIQMLDKTARIKISDCFDSSSYLAFKQAYSPLIANAAVQFIEVDVSALGYMDSAALGMLVQLDEKAKIAGKSIVLIGVPGSVAKILRVTNADKLFSINLPSGMKLDLRG
ncbi:MAG: anti-sigma factor antagonist [Gallionellaceae bacterium]|nr:MAG: anti-sigma factor antagonist [Gallionellaceae bacterium]